MSFGYSSRESTGFLLAVTFAVQLGIMFMCAMVYGLFAVEILDNTMFGYSKLIEAVGDALELRVDGQRD